MSKENDLALRATIARDGAPLARPARKPDPPARPAYVPPPAAHNMRECNCGLLMVSIGDVHTCACGEVHTLYSVTHEGAAGWVKTFAVTRR